MTALTMSPAELRLAARALGRETDDLRRLGSEIRCAVPQAGEWSGLASVQHGAWRSAWAQLVTEAIDPLDDLADRVAGFADQVEEGQQRIRQWLSRKEEGVRELLDIERLLRSADDAVRAELERRAEQARSLIAQARAELSEAEDGLRARAEELAAAVADSWPVRVVADLLSLDKVRRGVKALGRAWHLLVGSGVLLRLAVQYAKEQGVAARKVVVQSTRLAALLVLRAPRAATFAARFVHPTTFVLLTAVGAFGDLLTAGGYEGWRGVTTRVLGGLTLAALPGLLVPHPVVIGVSLAVLAAYTTWTAANLVYDNRAVLVKIQQFALRKTAEAAKAIEERLQILERVEAVAGQVQQLGRGIHRGWGIGWDWTTEHLNPLPDPDDPIGRRIPIPIRIPVPGGPTVPIWLDESDVKEWLPRLPDLPDLRWPGVPDLPDLRWPGVPDLPDLPEGLRIPISTWWSEPHVPDLPRWPRVPVLP